jgi:TRAP-type C4-dicarboxylate transport system substrate-binding protein
MTTTRVRSISTAGAIVALALAAGLASAQQARSAEYTMKLGVLSVNDAEHGFEKRLKVAIEKATNGKVEVKIFPRGQLGSPAAHVQGLQLGTIEGVVMPPDFFVSVDPRMGVFSIPFMFKNREQANKVLQDKELYNYVLDMLDSKGIVGITLAAHADGRYIAHKPLAKLSDFAGKKMRVNATDAERERMKRLGATAIPMGLPDMVTSLQSGVIDGTMSGMSIHANFHLETVSKVLLKTEDTLLISYGGLSKKWLDSLPADLRATIVKTARGMQKDMIEETDLEDKNLTKSWLDRGGSFITFSSADMAEMHKKLDSVGATVTAKPPELKAFYEKVKAISDRT